MLLLGLLLLSGLCSLVGGEPDVQAPLQPVSFSEQYEGQSGCTPGRKKGDCDSECTCNKLRQWECISTCPAIKPAPNCISVSPNPRKYPNNCCNEIKCPCDNYPCPVAYGEVNKTCELDENNKPQCVCPEFCTFELRPVCGTDGRTYPNPCALGVEACKSGKRITIRHEGECECKSVSKTCNAGDVCNNCQARCSCTEEGNNWQCLSACPPVQGPDCYTEPDTGEFPDHCCPKLVCPCQYTRCGLSGGQPTTCALGENNQAVCRCNQACEKSYFPVCGSDGKTYGNLCMLNVASCLGGKIITVVNQGECKVKYNGL